ncbi:unnamed protein product [Didymodactylos carnosus]|uniref:Glycosyltransferase 2-like domain-containing protein n=1 Tax=Didymodactylos carnosus TaxID=1234261 RepID=A0A8S2PE17_9BILA|nr:unnamed protein product [Didymodactylos carnosus]CAF4044715.1 unnamed protein product [Didymodactylos carnosus]
MDVNVQLNNSERLMPFLFTIGDFLLCIPTFMNCSTFWTALHFRPKLKWSIEDPNQNFPIVDIFIVCCNEPADILIDTVRSALSLNYPKDKYRIWVLDDGKSNEISNYVEQISNKYSKPDIHYRRRFKEINKPHYFKAGNINNGLSELNRLQNELPSEYLLVQDVDMILHPDFLLRTLPHFYHDRRSQLNESIAYVQTPQRYYNVTPGDLLSQALTGVNAILMHSDSKYSSTCIGSGMLIKLSILNEINRFPVDSITEDFNFSYSIHQLGYKSIFINEDLQFGLQPESLTAAIEQYKRWCLGNYQVIRLNPCSSIHKNMSLFQFCVYFSIGIRLWYCFPQLYLPIITFIALWWRLPFILLRNVQICKITLALTWFQYILHRLVLYTLFYDIVDGHDSTERTDVEAVSMKAIATLPINPVLCIIQIVERTIQHSLWMSPFYLVGFITTLCKLPIKSSI